MLDMRDLCEGISVKTGEVVRGQKLIDCNSGKAYIISDSKDCIVKDLLAYEEVIPGSIHRCSGCMDANKRYVFEGDKIYTEYGFIGRAAFDHTGDKWDVAQNDKFLGLSYINLTSYPWHEYCDADVVSYVNNTGSTTNKQDKNLKLVKVFYEISGYDYYSKTYCYIFVEEIKTEILELYLEKHLKTKGIEFEKLKVKHWMELKIENGCAYGGLSSEQDKVNQ